MLFLQRLDWEWEWSELNAGALYSISMGKGIKSLSHGLSKAYFLHNCGKLSKTTFPRESV